MQRTGKKEMVDVELWTEQSMPPTTPAPGPGTHIYGQGGGREDCGEVDVEVNEEMADAELCGVNALHHPCVSPAHRLAQLHHQRQARENQLTLSTRSAATHWCQTQSTAQQMCVCLPCLHTKGLKKRD